MATQVLSAGVIEEVVVTAEKRAESVQDVGLSVMAFDENALRRGGVEDVSRIDLLVPGVNFAFVGNDAKINVRGANASNTFADNSPVVGAFVDGVYKARASQQSRAFFDVERLEFLKGPQGTLYGRNTFAGALNLYTNAPNFEGVSGSISTSYERFDTSRVEGYVNIPVNDQLAVRVAGFFEDGDGYIENKAGPDMGAPDDRGIRISASWLPTDSFDAVLRLSRIEETGTEGGLFGYTNRCRNVTEQGITDPFGSEQDCQNPQRGSAGRPNANTIGPWEISQDFVPNADLIEDNVTLQMNWDVGPVMIKSISSYTDFENLIGFDFDFSPNPHQRGWFDETAESVTQELQFISNYEGPFQWTSGLYYSEDETFFSFSIFDHTVRDDSGRSSVIGPNGNAFTLFSGTPIVSRATSLGGFFADSTFIDTETFGAFTQGELTVMEGLRLIGGVRYNYERKNLFGGGSNFTSGGAPVNVLVDAGASPALIPDHPDDVFAINPQAAGATDFDESFDNVTWKAGFEYDVPDSDSMLYFTTSTGFLSGALNSDGTFTEEQESQVYELGAKNTFMNGRLVANLAGHYTEYTNLLTQFQELDPNTGNVITFSRNGGEIEAWGIELETVYLPTDNLRLSLLASVLDSEFGIFNQENPYQLFNGQVQSVVNVEGETTGWSPDFTSTVSASYDFRMGQYGMLTPSIQFFYSDGYNTGNLLSTDPNHQQDSFTKTDLRLLWQSPSQKYSVEAYVENIEDEAVLARGNNGSQDNVQTGFLYPQNYGVRLKIAWD